MADSHHTWEVGRNEKEMEAENRRNGLNQPGFTVDLSAQTPSLHSEKTSTLSVWSNVEVRPTPCSGWCNGDTTWADSPWMIRDFECLAFFFFLTGISVCYLNTVSCCCCHNVSSWVERSSTLDKSLCPLFMCSADRIRPPLQLLSHASTARTAGDDIPFSRVTTWFGHVMTCLLKIRPRRAFIGVVHKRQTG